MLTAVCYSPGEGWSDVHDFHRVSELVEAQGNLVWAQAEIEDLSPETVATVAEELQLDPLAVEDAMNTRQRPKLEMYANHLFSVMHQMDEVDGQLEARQIACFVGPRWVLTIHSGAERTMRETRKRLSEGEKEPGRGPSFIMHALLDSIVDDYETKANGLEEEIEQLEDVALQEPSTQMQKDLYSLKQRLARLRRYAVPGERVLADIFGPNRFSLITEATAGHFRDVHDHLLRTLDQIRNVQDLVDAVIDLQRADQANALNEVTKRLTGWAAIIAVPTFIASVYGMNFELIPAEGELPGFLFALGLMSASGAGLYTWFKHRDWI